MKHQRKRKQNESSDPPLVVDPVDVTQTPEYIRWHKENHSPVEHSEFLSRGVNTPLVIADNPQPHET